MGSPTFYVYFEDDGPLTSYTLAGSISNLEEDVGAVSAVAVSADGTPNTTYMRPTLGVRIELERFGVPGANPVERFLNALQNHLDRGGLVGFSRDSAKTFCGVIPSGMRQGETTLDTRGNGYASWNGSAVTASGDEVVVESAAPGWRREILPVSSHSAGKIITSAGTSFSYLDTPAIVRWRDFYPVLYRPEAERGRPIVTHDRRRNYTLDLLLEYSVEMSVGLFRDATWTSGYEGRVSTGAPDSVIGGALPLADTTYPTGSAKGLTLGILNADGRFSEFR